MIGPIEDLISPLNELLANSLQDLFAIVLRRGNILDSHDTLEHNVDLRVTMRIDDARTVDQIDALHERDVLPDFGLAGDRRHVAHLLLLERVDH